MGISGNPEHLGIRRRFGTARGNGTWKNHYPGRLLVFLTDIERNRAILLLERGAQQRKFDADRHRESMEPYRDDENVRRDSNLGKRHRRHGHRNLGNPPLLNRVPVRHRTDEQPVDRRTDRRPANHQGRSEILFEFHPGTDSRGFLNGIRRSEGARHRPGRRGIGIVRFGEIFRIRDFRRNRRLPFLGIERRLRFRNRRLHHGILHEKPAIEIPDDHRHAPRGIERRIPVRRTEHERKRHLLCEFRNENQRMSGSDDREYVGARGTLEGIRNDETLRGRSGKGFLGRFYQLSHRPAPYRTLGIRERGRGRFLGTNRRIPSHQRNRTLLRELHRSRIGISEPVIPYRRSYEKNAPDRRVFLCGIIKRRYSRSVIFQTSARIRRRRISARNRFGSYTG